MVKSFSIALKFGRHLGSTAAEEPAKFQSDMSILIPDLTPLRFCEILWQDILLNRSPGSWYCLRLGAISNIKIPSYQWRYSHYKDKMISWPSDLNNGNLHTWKDSFYIEMGYRTLSGLSTQSDSNWTNSFLTCRWTTGATLIVMYDIKQICLYNSPNNSTSKCWKYGFHCNKL